MLSCKDIKSQWLKNKLTLKNIFPKQSIYEEKPTTNLFCNTFGGEYCSKNERTPSRFGYTGSPKQKLE
jgi:hypothetical protein